MKVYLVYTVTESKAIDIPDKFAPLAAPHDWPDDWPDDLFNELDDYTNTEAFYSQCRDIDGDICAIENEDGNILVEW